MVLLLTTLYSILKQPLKTKSNIKQPTMRWISKPSHKATTCCIFHHQSLPHAWSGLWGAFQWHGSHTHHWPLRDHTQPFQELLLRPHIVPMTWLSKILNIRTNRAVQRSKSLKWTRYFQYNHRPWKRFESLRELSLLQEVLPCCNCLLSSLWV